MAKCLGIAPNTYGKLESGETKMSPERLQKIADIFETTPEAIKAYDEKVVLNNHSQNGGNSGYGYHVTVKNSFDDLSKIIEHVISPYKAMIERQQIQLEQQKVLITELESKIETLGRTAINKD